MYYCIRGKMKTIVISTGNDQFNLLSSCKKSKKSCNSFSLVENEAIQSVDECIIDWDFILYRTKPDNNNKTNQNNIVQCNWFVKGPCIQTPVTVFRQNEVGYISKALVCGNRIYGLNKDEGIVYFVKLENLELLPPPSSSTSSSSGSPAPCLDKIYYEEVKFQDFLESSNLSTIIKPFIIDISSSGKECFAIDSNSGIYKVPNLLWRIQGTNFCNIYSGFGFNLLLTDTGAVFSFGNGSRGELGQRITTINNTSESKNETNQDDDNKSTSSSTTTTTIPKPERLEFFDDLPSIVVSLSCGGWHSLALTSDGDCYSWGWNESGQLGHSMEKLSSISSDPHPIDLGSYDDPIVDIGAGARHSFVVLKSGRIYSFGFNKFGQLGVGDNENRHLPTLVETSHLIDPCDIDNSKRKVRVQCGRWITLLYYYYSSN